jgi:hypothetical protein
MIAPMLLALAAAPAPDNAVAATPRQIEALVAGYADCVVKRHEKAAAEAILTDASDQDLTSKYPELVQSNCIPMKLGDYVQVRFTPTNMRNAIATALVRRELGNLPPPALDDVPRLSHRVGRDSPELSSGKLGRHAAEAATIAFERRQLAAYLSRYGECVVRVDPAAAKVLLLADQFTSAEAAAWNGMSVALGTCLAEGRSLQFDKGSLRGSIAVNYYRLASAARTQQAARH